MMDSINEAEELEKFSPTSDRRPFEVILRGGKPWGLNLAGGEGEDSALHIAQIAEGSKAENSALLTGDIVLSVNGVACGGTQTARQLIDSAFRTLTLTVLRGGSRECSRASRALSFQQRSSASPSQQQQQQSPRDRAGSLPHRHLLAAAHDDSALYTQSKASQQSAAMKPSRPRRGDSFTVGKSRPTSSPSPADPPWARPPSGYSRPGPASHTSSHTASHTSSHTASHTSSHPASHSSSRSSYPDIRDPHRPSSKSDRRYSDAPNRQKSRDRDRGPEHPMVASKSSPDLNKAEVSSPLPSETSSSSSPSPSSVKPVKSSSDIPEDVGRERAGSGKRPSGYEQQMLRTLTAGQSYGRAAYGVGEAGRPRGDPSGHRAKRVSEDMYTSDMNTLGECKPVPSHSLQKYQPDYENMAMLATAPLQSEKISEIVDIEDGLDSDIPGSPQPTGSRNPYCPTPPERDLATLKYGRVNQNHEKYPSWPVSQPSSAPEQAQPINTRAQSWTDHTATSKEFPAKGRPAYQPDLRPLQEKNSSASEPRGEDSSGKAARNSSDPGLKAQPEFVYDHFGRVVQKRPDMKGKFEDFYQNSKPGYLPPKFDSDGHSYGDKEYNAPSPPERDVAGIDRHVLSEALGGESGERRIQSHPGQKVPQPQEPSSQWSGAGKPRTGAPGEGSVQAGSPHNPALKKPPGALPLQAPHGGADPRRADMATSPLASPQGAASSSRPPSTQGVVSPAHRDFMYRDCAASRPPASSSSRPYIVKQTPYYNTSTQTDVHSYAVKLSDPRARQCNVEIQVGTVGSQTSPRKEFEEKSIQARMSREFQPSDLDPASPKKLPYKDKRNFFQYSFQGMQSIQAKYATDTDASASSQPAEMFSFGSGDQASIMRKLSEEFFGSGKMGHLGDKRHSSASSQEHSPKPVDSSSMSVHSGTMSQAESYTSVIIHPAESAGPFGRDDFGSQSSITDSGNDLTSLASGSQSSLKDTAPRGRNSLEYFPRSAPRPLQEARKFNSLTSISHQRERSGPAASRHSESRLPGQEGYLDTRSHRSGSHRNSSSGSEPSPSQTKSPVDSRGAANAQLHPADKFLRNQPGSQPALTASHHAKSESADSVFSDHSAFDQKEGGRWRERAAL